jgi:hypothetical protein
MFSPSVAINLSVIDYETQDEDSEILRAPENRYWETLMAPGASLGHGIARYEAGAASAVVVLNCFEVNAFWGFARLMAMKGQCSILRHRAGGAFGVGE